MITEENLSTDLKCANNCDKLGDGSETPKTELDKSTLPNVLKKLLPPDEASGDLSNKTDCKKCVIPVPCHWMYIGAVLVLAYIFLDKQKTP